MPRPVLSHDTDAARHHDCPTSGRSVGRRQRCLQLPRGNATAQSPGGDSRRASGPGEYELGGSLHALLHRDTGSRGSSGVGRITADLTGGRTIPFGGKEWTVDVPFHVGGVASTGGHAQHGGAQHDLEDSADSCPRVSEARSRRPEHSSSQIPAVAPASHAVA